MAASPVKGGDLDYYASKLFLDPKTSQHVSSVTNTKELPQGFPTQYAAERVWTGADIALKQHEWAVVLSEQDHVHILQALRHFRGLQLGPESLSPETFPLPEQLHKRLRKISSDCYQGRGFSVLRGLRTESFTDEENVLVYGGISSHVAPIRGYQDIKRELVTCHVISTDTSYRVKEENLRPAFTNGRLAFHTDLGDILTLFAMDTSDTGGQTMIVSSSLIYNELAQARPELLSELAKPWAFFSSQNYDTEKTPLIINVPGDKLVFQFSRIPVTGFRSKGNNSTLPSPSPRLLEAMTYIEELGWKHCFPLPSQRGDIAYINNLCLMHARSAFDLDSAGNSLASKRHLVKLMLRDPELTWDLPPSLDWYTDRVYGPNQEDNTRTEKWDLGPESAKDGHIWAGSEGGMSNG